MSRTIVIEGHGHLSVRNRQLMLKRENTEQVVGAFEDLGFLVLENPRITLTQAVVAEAAANRVAVVFCDGGIHPSAVALPFEGNGLQNERMRAQLEATQPRQKQLWAWFVKQKIRNQARMAAISGADPSPIHYLSSKVRSGDPDNIEARAARIYWPSLFGREFRRNREGYQPNAYLNYGYAILRSACVRAIAGVGLIPSLGIHHHHRNNTFALADDLMEPFRPWVDRIAWSLVAEQGMDGETVDRPVKSALLDVLQHDVRMGDQFRPLRLAMDQTAYELAVALADSKARLTDIILTPVGEENPNPEPDEDFN